MCRGQSPVTLLKKGEAPWEFAFAAALQATHIGPIVRTPCSVQVTQRRNAGIAPGWMDTTKTNATTYSAPIRTCILRSFGLKSFLQKTKEIDPMNVHELYPAKWLTPADLKGRSHTLEIAGATLEQVYDTRKKQTVYKLAVAFVRARARLLCNKTQSFALAAACNSPETAEWIGHWVVLSPGVAPNGKETITVVAPKAQPGPAPAQPATANAQADAEEEDGEDDDPVTAGDFQDHEEA